MYRGLVGDDGRMRSGRDVLAGLAPGWQAAFGEAWESWRTGSYGIGAALIDPDTNSVVSVGRNRVAQSEPEPGLLSGNMTAHAEMNTFAALDRFNADGLHLYTTLQPCLMCAASAMLLKVSHVHFAANDEFFHDLDDLWQHHPVTASRTPVRSGPLSGTHARLAQFARLLPMSFTLGRFPDRAAATLARQTHPSLASLADRLAMGEATELRRLETVDEGLDAVWNRLPTD